MDPQLSILLFVVAVLVVIAIVAWIVMRQRRRRALREHFGPEYEHVVQETGSPDRAERVLAEREHRVKKLDIRPLPDTARDLFVSRWRRVQERFVDDPEGAMNDADALIGEAMEARGYPVGDFEQRAADVSVEHPGVVRNYRSAHAIATRGAGDVTTEDRRAAMVQYRELFNEIVGAEPARERVEETDREEAAR